MQRLRKQSHRRNLLTSPHVVLPWNLRVLVTSRSVHDACIIPTRPTRDISHAHDTARSQKGHADTLQSNVRERHRLLLFRNRNLTYTPSIPYILLSGVTSDFAHSFPLSRNNRLCSPRRYNNSKEPPSPQKQERVGRTHPKYKYFG